MITSIWEDLKRQYNYGNMITRLILINVVVFIVVNLIKLGITIFGGFEHNDIFYTYVERYFALHGDFVFNLTHPWVIITHMFFHVGFMHILFNMLFLYWFGRIVGDFIGNDRILPIYLMGGLFGALFYFGAANFMYDGESIAYGASAAMMAFVVASGVLSPNYTMNLILIGEVKLKYIVAVLVFLDLVAVGNLSNTGGAIAHLGGAFFGWIYITQLRNGNDWAKPVIKILDQLSLFFNNLFKGRSRGPRVAYKNPNKTTNWSKKEKPGRSSDTERSSHQDKLDAILDKIKKNGYESLTAEEKEFLFNASKK